MTARKNWDLPLLYSLLDVMCSVCRRGGCVQYICIGGEGGQTKRQKARVLTLIGVLTSSAVGQWPSRLDFYHDGHWERQPMQPDLEGAGLLRAFGNSSCQYTALMSLGMTLIRANTIAFGLIGKDGPHGIIKICCGNMNLVFGSEVALLGFWGIYVSNSIPHILCPQK